MLESIYQESYRLISVIVFWFSFIPLVHGFFRVKSLEEKRFSRLLWVCVYLLCIIGMLIYIRPGLSSSSYSGFMPDLAFLYNIFVLVTIFYKAKSWSVDWSKSYKVWMVIYLICIIGILIFIGPRIRSIYSGLVNFVSCLAVIILGSSFFKADTIKEGWPANYTLWAFAYLISSVGMLFFARPGPGSFYYSGFLSDLFFWLTIVVLFVSLFVTLERKEFWVDINKTWMDVYLICIIGMLIFNRPREITEETESSHFLITNFVFWLTIIILISSFFKAKLLRKGWWLKPGIGEKIEKALYEVEAEYSWRGLDDLKIKDILDKPEYCLNSWEKKVAFKKIKESRSFYGDCARYLANALCNERGLEESIKRININSKIYETVEEVEKILKRKKLSEFEINEIFKEHSLEQHEKEEANILLRLHEIEREAHMILAKHKLHRFLDNYIVLYVNDNSEPTLRAIDTANRAKTFAELIERNFSEKDIIEIYSLPWRKKWSLINEIIEAGKTPSDLGMKPSEWKKNWNGNNRILKRSTLQDPEKFIQAWS